MVVVVVGGVVGVVVVGGVDGGVVVGPPATPNRSNLFLRNSSAVISGVGLLGDGVGVDGLGLELLSLLLSPVFSGLVLLLSLTSPPRNFLVQLFIDIL